MLLQTVIGRSNTEAADMFIYYLTRLSGHLLTRSRVRLILDRLHGHCGNTMPSQLTQMKLLFIKHSPTLIVTLQPGRLISELVSEYTFVTNKPKFSGPGVAVQKIL